ncbi:MAG: riboflavin synthase [Alteromonadaceae bacterium]|nr:riboflavin synthase [Alteromonadaceae bacterium]
MFTGIIEAVGTIKSLQITANGARLAINAGTLDMSDVKLGDSIATNGICLTVVDLSGHNYSVDVSNETLQCTCFGNYQQGQQVNLEKAMLATTRFGGHMVSGHVDAKTKIVAINNNGNSIEYWLALPQEFAHYVSEKGSITIDGISLTVNAISNDQFRLTIVPHTLEQTIMKHYQVGSEVNLEVDLIARYLERLLTKNETEKSGGVTEELLRNSGFM